tara:strand:- start:2935 stop:3297 length:363 start_codon:yes stop_codon:yes gene_type:complete
MQDFRKLKVWEKAHAFVLEVYRASELFPSQEKFGLTSQIRRAASSIPMNIAEGCGRNTNPDLARFLHIAMGSASEVEYLLILAKDLTILPEDRFPEMEAELFEIKRMLNALIQKVQETNH